MCTRYAIWVWAIMANGRIGRSVCRVGLLVVCFLNPHSIHTLSTVDMGFTAPRPASCARDSTQQGGLTVAL